MAQVTSSEFARQCHSANSHSQDVNGTSRKCSPLYLEKKSLSSVREKKRLEVANAKFEASVKLGVWSDLLNSTDIPLYSAHVVWKKANDTS